QSGARLYASRPAGFGLESGAGAEVDPQRITWNPVAATPTIGYLDRETSGEETRLRWLSVSFPFKSEPAEIAASARAIVQFGWTSAGTPYYSTRSDDGATTRVYVVIDGVSKEIWQGNVTDRYNDPGRALRIDGSDGPALEVAGRVFLAGDGLGPDGPRPFLEELDLATAQKKSLFTADDGVFEEVLAVLDPRGPVLLTSRETESSPPNLYRVEGNQRTALRPLASPYPALESVERRRVNYRRGDGVALAGTLYLPAGWDGANPLPTLIWIYPYEFADREHAEQLDVRNFRFHQVTGPSPLAAVLAGYAVLVNPTMPIVDEGNDVEESYLRQLVDSAEAAVDYLVDAGISDPERVAVGGRSYGAFSTANLLIHSQRFATGIAMSGAYNRTLTPFGFQHEKRSFWDATSLYMSISPFFHANKLRVPLLLVHGGADPNPGTPTLQARRFFHALAGEGATVRYVELPIEGHKYLARESVLDAAAEMISWLHETIGPHATTGRQTAGAVSRE
ncbi:MAG: prolyl oligopeptidase family serine peptidase, partial [Halioglobus sp.]